MRPPSELFVPRGPGRTHEPSSRANGVRRMGEHAGVRRAPCSWAVGKMAPCRAGAAGATEDRGGVVAGAHARHMRRRTSGLCQLTLHPRPISRLSSASLPSFAACHKCLSLPFSAAAFSAAAFSAAALELPEPICSARSWRRVLWRRERVGRRVSLTRNRRKSQAPEAPKVRSMPCSTRALRGTGRRLSSWQQGPARTSTP